jgi:uncharacterized protein
MPSHSPVRHSSFAIRQFLALLLLLPAACTADTSTAPAPATTSAPATAPIAFETTAMTLKGKAFTMEVAVGDAQTERGLMYRDSMPDDHGMLFVMPYVDTWAFWMHNTRIPLDIIFIDRAGKVLEIHNRAALDDTGRGPTSPAQYVIELNLGAAQKIGLARGDIVEIPKKYMKN